MAYSLPKTHIPRQPGYIPAPPSRWNNPATRFSGDVGSPANRPGKTFVPGKYKGNPNRKLNPRPGPMPRPGKRYVPRPASVPEKVRRAVERAFPVPRPYGGPWRSIIGNATRTGEAVGSAREAWETTSEAMKSIEEALNTQWWNRSPPYNGPNPGLAFLETRKHTAYASPNYTPPSNTGWVAATDYRNINQNNWLRAIWYGTPPKLTGWLAATLPVGQIVPAGHFLYIPNRDYDFRLGSPSNWYADTRVYRNLSGAPMPAIVAVPGAFPLPLGAPLPLGVPNGYPLARTVAAPKPLPRPVRVYETAIEFPPSPPPSRPPVRVYPSRPRKPGPKAKETKSYGKSGAASAAFWLYEATDDWVDWVEILISAIPGAPENLTPLEAINWLRQNPEKVAKADWGEVISALAGWLVDEAFGAFVGNINKRANRSTAVSAQTVDMRTNAPLHYSGGNGSPGQFVTDFLNAFM